MKQIFLAMFCCIALQAESMKVILNGPYTSNEGIITDARLIAAIEAYKKHRLNSIYHKQLLQALRQIAGITQYAQVVFNIDISQTSNASVSFTWSTPPMSDILCQVDTNTQNKSFYNYLCKIPRNMIDAFEMRPYMDEGITEYSVTNGFNNNIRLGIENFLQKKLKFTNFRWDPSLSRFAVAYEEQSGQPDTMQAPEFKVEALIHLLSNDKGKIWILNLNQNLMVELSSIDSPFAERFNAWKAELETLLGGGESGLDALSPYVKSISERLKLSVLNPSREAVLWNQYGLNAGIALQILTEAGNVQFQSPPKKALGQPIPASESGVQLSNRSAEAPIIMEEYKAAIHPNCVIDDYNFLDTQSIELKLSAGRQTLGELNVKLIGMSQETVKGLIQRGMKLADFLRSIIYYTNPDISRKRQSSSKTISGPAITPPPAIPTITPGAPSPSTAINPEPTAGVVMPTIASVPQIRAIGEIPNADIIGQTPSREYMAEYALNPEVMAA